MFIISYFLVVKLLKRNIFVFILIFIFLVGCAMNTSATGKWSVSLKKKHLQGENIRQEIIPIRNNMGNIMGFDIIITIPSDNKTDRLIISPSIFDGINHYYNIFEKNNIKINLIINNKSKYNYHYINNSFILSTENIGENDNYVDTGGIGFDNLKIYDISSPYRTFNSALLSLFNYTNNNYKSNDLSDKSIDSKLKESGYSGIDELDLYYLDYYNDKYNLNELRLEDFSSSILKEMFDGVLSNYKESNIQIIQLAYNFFYNEILFFSFHDNNIGYSIGKYMRSDNVEDDYLLKTLIVDSNKVCKVDNMSIYINKKNMGSAYSNYKFNGHFEFILKKY